VATWLLTLGGIGLTLLSILETWMAVLYPRAVSGPVTSLVYRLHHNLSRRIFAPSSQLLLFNGPFLIVAQLVVWATLLLLGVTLIVWPQLGTDIAHSNGSATNASFAMAVYYAGFCLTTLGVGDLVPQTTFTRMMTITAGAIGFSFFTLVLAYIISVYSALGRRNQFACEIDYRTGRTGDTLAYLKSYLASDDRSLLNQDLIDLASKLADLLESHHFYPALHYFRFSEPRYAMSRILRFSLETASLLRAISQLQPENSTMNVEPTERLWHAGLQTLEDAKKHFVICRVSRGDIDLSLAKRCTEHFLSTAAGARTLPPDDLVSAYADNCREWSNDLESLERCTMTGHHRHPDSA